MFLLFLYPVLLPNGLRVWWDGYARLYVDAPASLKSDGTNGNALTQPLSGLCGNFNGNQMDDFTTPEGDVEQDAVTFANRWEKMLI